jgi:hypothetical protein
MSTIEYRCKVGNEDSKLYITPVEVDDYVNRPEEMTGIIFFKSGLGIKELMMNTSDTMAVDLCEVYMNYEDRLHIKSKNGILVGVAFYKFEKKVFTAGFEEEKGIYIDPECCNSSLMPQRIVRRYNAIKAGRVVKTELHYDGKVVKQEYTLPNGWTMEYLLDKIRPKVKLIEE